MPLAGNCPKRQNFCHKWKETKTRAVHHYFQVLPFDTAQRFRLPLPNSRARPAGHRATTETQEVKSLAAHCFSPGSFSGFSYRLLNQRSLESRNSRQPTTHRTSQICKSRSALNTTNKPGRAHNQHRKHRTGKKHR